MWMHQVYGLCFLTLVTYVNCKPVTIHSYAPAHDEYKPTDYSFSYGVKDLHSGDIKHQWEKKEGDTVKGQYSLVEPDGSIRIVDYSADDKSGFNAVVKHSGPFQHPADYSKKPISHSDVVLKQGEAQYEQPEIKYEQEEAKEPEYETKYEYIYPRQHAAEYSQIDTPDYKGESDVTYGVQQQEEEAEDDKEGYGYPPQEELAEESQRSTVRSVLKHQQVHAKEPSVVKPPKPTRVHYQNVKTVQQLPVDLNLLKKQVIPVDVSVIKPIEIDLSAKEPERNKYANHQMHNVQTYKQIQQSHELSQEELNKYLENYYKTNKVNQPVMEGGFKPVKSTPITASKAHSPQVSKPAVQQTFKTNKKPATTPGLTHFSSHRLQQNNSNNNRHPSRLPNIEYFRKVPLKSPYQYANNYSNELRLTRQTSRLYRSAFNNGYDRYAKNIGS